jgi:predicted short-subunit dehydrogenase-like oxidoreductase (DUF2520 family)
MEKNQSYNIVIVGAGNVATQLAPTLQKAGHKILQVYSQTEQSASKLANLIDVPYTKEIDKIIQTADIYFLLINDDFIENFAAKMTHVESILLHSSGSLPLSVLSRYAKNYGVFYPIQTISKNVKVNFENIPICIEANSVNCLNILKNFTLGISSMVYEIDSAQRLKVHLAAVFANNLNNHLINIAKQLLNESHISFDLLKPLILETAMKAIEQGPENVQTGPAKRNDKAIMKKHLELLSCKPEWKKIYRIISNSIRDSR